MKPPHIPFVPAKAGIQSRTMMLAILGPRLRGDERRPTQFNRNLRSVHL